MEHKQNNAGMTRHKLTKPKAEYQRPAPSLELLGPFRCDQTDGYGKYVGYMIDRKPRYFIGSKYGDADHGEAHGAERRRGA